MWVRKLDILWDKRWCYCSQLVHPQRHASAPPIQLWRVCIAISGPWTMRSCNHRSWSALASGCPCKILECKAVPRLYLEFVYGKECSLIGNLGPLTLVSLFRFSSVGVAWSSQGFDVCCVCGEVPGVMVWRTSFADLGPACARKEAKPLLRRP